MHDQSHRPAYGNMCNFIQWKVPLHRFQMFHHHVTTLQQASPPTFVHIIPWIGWFQKGTKLKVHGGIDVWLSIGGIPWCLLLKASDGLKVHPLLSSLQIWFVNWLWKLFDLGVHCRSGVNLSWKIRKTKTTKTTITHCGFKIEKQSKTYGLFVMMNTSQHFFVNQSVEGFVSTYDWIASWFFTAPLPAKSILHQLWATNSVQPFFAPCFQSLNASVVLLFHDQSQLRVGTICENTSLEDGLQQNANLKNERTPNLYRSCGLTNLAKDTRLKFRHLRFMLWIPIWLGFPHNLNS